MNTTAWAFLEKDRTDFLAIGPRLLPPRTSPAWASNPLKAKIMSCIRRSIEDIEDPILDSLY
jgi:hypothetical protein